MLETHHGPTLRVFIRKQQLITRMIDVYQDKSQDTCELSLEVSDHAIQRPNMYLFNSKPWPHPAHAKSPSFGS